MKKFVLTVIALSLLLASCAAGPAGRSGYYSPYDEDDDIPLIFHHRDRSHSRSFHDRDYNRDNDRNYHGDDDGDDRHLRHGSHRGERDDD